MKLMKIIPAAFFITVMATAGCSDAASANTTGETEEMEIVGRDSMIIAVPVGDTGQASIPAAQHP